MFIKTKNWTENVSILNGNDNEMLHIKFPRQKDWH